MFSPDAVLVILGMAAITYGLRAGGLLLGGRLPREGPWARALSALPGVILVSIVLPAMLSEGLFGVLAGTLTALVMLRTRNLVVAMLVGIAFIAAARWAVGA